METIKEIWAFLRVRKKFWMAPIILTLMAMGLLMWVVGNGSVVSSFIYAL